jgi:hypothetical protein
MGLFGLDTWAAVAIYLRNLLLNQAILILALSVVLLLPRLAIIASGHVTWTSLSPYGSTWYALGFWFLVVLLPFVVMWFLAINIVTFLTNPKRGTQVLAMIASNGSGTVVPVIPPSPPHRGGWSPLLSSSKTVVDIWDPTYTTKRNSPGTKIVAFNPADPADPKAAPSQLTLSQLTDVQKDDVVVFHEQFPRTSNPALLRWTIIAPIFLAAVAAICWLADSQRLTDANMGWAEAAFWGAALCLCLWGIAVVVLCLDYRRKKRKGFRAVHPSYVAGPLPFRCFIFFLGTATSGAVGGLLMKLLLKYIPYTARPANSLDLGIIGCFSKGSHHAATALSAAHLHLQMIYGVPLTIIVLLLVGVIHIGLLGICIPDIRREWFGRLAGWFLIVCFAWTVLFAIAVESTEFVCWVGTTLGPHVVKWGLTPAWVFSTVSAVLAGKSKKTGDDKGFSALDAVATIGPYVFVIGLLVALSVGIDEILRPENIGVLLCWLPGGTSLQVLAVFVVCVFTAWLLAWRVDINEFSMNLMYRNRMVRCYLGASNRRRLPNPFSGMDPDDDMLLSDLTSKMYYTGPLPIINTALNLVAGSDLALQERKAESFVMTPLHCGYDVWLEKSEHRGESEDNAYGRYGYRPTKYYGYWDGGIRLGTAASISGAAASPNMGYHSNPAAAFLMTVFNVRLGWWVGNPRHATTWQDPGPTVGLWSLIDELLGDTTDAGPFVYLSDGGHFENLGIYEMVKRRCKFVLACDADADEGLKFDDLAGAIEKCRSDIGVDIVLKTEPLALCGTPATFSKWHRVIGEIRYDQVDLGQTNGILVYIKASMTGDESTDVLSYKRNHETFLHETTAGQWFTESQFECHRSLGLHVARMLLSTLPSNPVPPTLAQVFTGLQQIWKNP